MGSKRRSKERNAATSITRARNRVIENCWRAEKLGSGGCVKVLLMAIDIIKAHGKFPSSASKDAVVSEASRIARERGFKANFPKRASTHKPKIKKSADLFYSSWEWKEARYKVIKLSKQRCLCCGWQPGDTERGHLVVDHIKPRSKFPELALELSNLQVLCNDCNMGKSNTDMTDWMDEAYSWTIQ